MTKQPLFKQDPSDLVGGYLLSPAGVLLLAGGAAYGADDEITPQGRANAKAALARILSAARAGGFTQSDVLDTLFARGEVSKRVRDMASTAVEAAGSAALREIVVSLRGHHHD